MSDKWIEYTKKADFAAWGKELKISPLTARIIRNRGVETLEEAREYLYGSVKDLTSPYFMKDIDYAADLIIQTIEEEGKIAIVSDFDDDGIFAGEILYEGLKKIGGLAEIFTPERVTEGYGLNVRIIDEAILKGCSMILTCDNGIAAIGEVKYAKDSGLRVVVTDHHEIQYEETTDLGGNKTRHYLIPEADAVVNPKRPDCSYPFKELCGAGVAFKLIQVLFDKTGVPEENLGDLYQYVAIATVADIVPLKGENRILLKEGLKKLHYTRNIGLTALIEECMLKKDEIGVYEIGFILGPCFNAVGRLKNVAPAFSLLQTEDPGEAKRLAKEIHELNEQRKQMTEAGAKKAEEKLKEENRLSDNVLTVLLEDTHESVAGIIAGRLKEKYYKPVFVFTFTGDGNIKASGRSIEGYHMLDGLIEVRPLLLKFGGHAMAAGVTMIKENFGLFRKFINENAKITDEMLRRKVHIDARVPMSYLNEALVKELSVIAPCGTGNAKPLFAVTHAKISKLRVIGKNRNVLRMNIDDNSGSIRDAIMFGDPAVFYDFLSTEFTKEQIDRMEKNGDDSTDVAFTYYPEINEYMGIKSIQPVLQSFCRIK